MHFTKTVLERAFVLKIVDASKFDMFLTENVLRRFNFKEATQSFYDYY